ncbi:hypothetical protein Y032_0451g1692 [Ancylostoma ceylanicum]|uniref:Uncharacterized protein n=1 Tax=Ancylostoma ceylanicum TaxID=53326 RepID=A0A016WYL6_9BILA|nr:hypothetical protein Y032_0451g1692 [Ancylostoma ceylanicum]
MNSAKTTFSFEVEVRAQQWLADVSPSMAGAWFRHILREENHARVKQLPDEVAEDVAMETPSSASLTDAESEPDRLMECA